MTALSDLRVIELANDRIAFAGKLLADMGADVILVEPPGGDATRGYEPFLDDEPGDERSLYFWHYNTSKRGITIDLETDAGRGALRRLVATADVFLESEDAGRLEALGIDALSLRAGHPELISVSMAPFMRGGPREHELATDLTLLAGGGPAWSCGYDDHSLPPVRGGGNQGYQTGCHYAVMAALVALVSRDVTGAGQHIDVDMHAAQNVTTEAGSYSWLVAEETVQRQTGRHAGVNPSAPSQVQCGDGRWVNTGVPARRGRDYEMVLQWLAERGLDEQFPATPLLEMGKSHGILDLSKIATDPAIREMFQAGRDAMVLLAQNMSAYEFFEGAQQRGFQVGIIYSPEEVMEDRHFKARRFPTEVPHPDLGRSFTYPGAPYLFHGSPWQIQRRAPLLGEHADAILEESGFAPDEVAQLRAQGVV
ncbi:MAG: CoA transferase [Chloroflexi bacterium]|nr:CoA transferase [Chloroflexota bacterium]MDA1145632.1 CoA transferase [Chloroflexota bacterium]